MKRRAREDDVRAVHAIYVHESVVPFLGYDPMPLEAFRPIFAALIVDEDFHVFEADGAVAGFYKLNRQKGRSAHVALLGPLAIAPDLQGRGVGRAMLEDALDDLERDGVTRVELLAEADNLRGLAFYERLGFHREGVQFAAYKRGGDSDHVDEVMMVRFLGALAERNPPNPA